MKLKHTLELYKNSIDYMQVHDVFMIEKEIEGSFMLYKNRTLTIEKIFDDFSGLTVWMRDSYDKKHVIKGGQFRNMSKIC